MPTQRLWHELRGASETFDWGAAMTALHSLETLLEFDRRAFFTQRRRGSEESFAGRD